MESKKAVWSVWVVCVTSGKVGFPVGPWMRVCSRGIAKGVQRRLAGVDGVSSVVLRARDEVSQ